MKKEGTDIKQNNTLKVIVYINREINMSQVLFQNI